MCRTKCPISHVSSACPHERLFAQSPLLSFLSIFLLPGRSLQEPLPPHQCRAESQPAGRYHVKSTIAAWRQPVLPQVTSPRCSTILRSSTFQSSDPNDMYILDVDHDESVPPTEIDDEQSRKALASPLFPQESEEEAGLRQTCHSNEEKLSKTLTVDFSKYGETGMLADAKTEIK